MFIEIEGVSKQFMHDKVPILALQDINLSVEKGDSMPEYKRIKDEIHHVCEISL